MYIKLPETGAQDDDWSCGPNSAARVLRYYGHDVDYGAVRGGTDARFILPDSITVPDPSWSNPFATKRVNIRAGTTPNLLCQVMRRWDDSVQLKQKAEFHTLVNLLKEGKPAIVLLRTGSLDFPVVGRFPALHWLVVVGINEPQQLVYFTETNSQTYQLSYGEFKEQWSWRIGDGLASEALWKLEVKTETVIWIERNRSPLPKKQ